MAIRFGFWRAAGIAVACGLALAGEARAATFDITSDAAAYGYDTIHLNDAAGIFPGGATSIWVYSGADRVGGTIEQTGRPVDLVVFCVDVLHWLVSPPMTYSGGVLADTVPDPVKQQQIWALIADGSDLLASGHYGAYSATEISSALQIAVWTAEYQTGDTAYDVTDSARGFWVSGPSNATDVTLADTFLADVTSDAWAPREAIVELEALNPTPNQNLSFAVPEPATLVLGVGLLGLVGLRRRRR